MDWSRLKSRFLKQRSNATAGVRESNRHTDSIRALLPQLPHWHHRYEILPGVVTPGSYDPGFMWKLLALPTDLTGMRVLDLGSSDGYFIKKLIEAGADVLAVDIIHKSRSGLGILERAIGREIPFLEASIYDLPQRDLGKFDIVLFLGLIYHLPDMCRGLDIVRELCSGTAHIESHVDTVNSTLSVAAYHRDKSLNNDYTNFWSPTVPCLRDMLTDAGFQVIAEHTWGDRALMAAKSKPDRSFKYGLAYDSR